MRGSSASVNIAIRASVLASTSVKHKREKITHIESETSSNDPTTATAQLRLRAVHANTIATPAAPISSAGNRTEIRPSPKGFDG